MDGPASIRPQSPDWRYTHTASTTISKPATTTTTPTINSNSNSYTTSPIEKRTYAPLPSLARLDFSKITRDAQSNHELSKHISPITTTASFIQPALNSPASGYPGPPPPYSSCITTPNIMAKGGYMGFQSHSIPPPPPPLSVNTTTETRRPIVEDESQRLATHTLPSIQEALGKGPGPFQRGAAHPSSIPPPPPSSMTAPSPTTPLNRSHANSLSSHPSNPYETQHTRTAEAPTRPTIEVIQRDPRIEESRRYPPEPHSAYRVPNSPRASVLQTPQSHPSSPSFFNHPRTQGLPAVQPPQSYSTSYPPAYAYPPPSSYPNQPAPSSTWREEQSRSDYARSEDERKGLPPLKPSRASPGPYHHGESVKRHLETFDLELGLNELAEGSSRTLEFARKYVDKAHHMHRSGIATALPSMAECNDMYNLQRSILNSMDRIREIVVTQQHALAEQRSREEAIKARQASFAGQSNDMYDKDEGAGGFAGSDPKKRRGRHAPPGRCHSCARSETPEWRRGPDGARTLCNACGLHYAKLTRKLGPKAPPPGSSLRSSENGAPSP